MVSHRLQSVLPIKHPSVSVFLEYHQLASSRYRSPPTIVTGFTKRRWS